MQNTKAKQQGTKKIQNTKSQAKFWGGGVQLFDANPRHSLAFPSSPQKLTGLSIHQDIFPLCNLYTAMLVDVFNVFGRCLPHQATKAQIKGTKPKPLWCVWVQLFDANPRHSLAFPSSSQKHTGLSIHQVMFPLCNLYTAMLVDVFNVFGRCFPTSYKGTNNQNQSHSELDQSNNSRLPFIPTETHWLERASVTI